jgi:hypothetical protein
MPDAPIRSAEFDENCRKVLAQAGAVTLPYPPPASGELYIGISPYSHPELPSGAPRFFLRVVQKVGRSQVIRRVVDLDELRGISLPARSAKEDKAQREFHTVNEIAQAIAEAKARLIAAEKAAAGVYELCLYEDAVIYIRELAPVHLRIEYEFGVSAAEAAENVERLLHSMPCCKPMDPGSFPEP